MKRHTQETKHQALQWYLQGYSPAETASRLAIPQSTVSYWYRGWDRVDAPLAHLPLEEIGPLLESAAALRQQFNEAERSLKIIHESGVLSLLPIDRRIAAARQLTGTYSNTLLCQALEIHPSVYYYHIRREAHPTNRQQQEAALAAAVEQAYLASGGRFGAERIQQQLKSQGIRTSKRRVIHLMKKLRLSGTENTGAYYPAGICETTEDQDVSVL